MITGGHRHHHHEFLVKDLSKIFALFNVKVAAALGNLSTESQNHATGQLEETCICDGSEPAETRNVALMFQLQVNGRVIIAW